MFRYLDGSCVVVNPGTSCAHAGWLVESSNKTRFGGQQHIDEAFKHLDEAFMGVRQVFYDESEQQQASGTWPSKLAVQMGFARAAPACMWLPC